jgi:uncharacterized membrane protein YdjX (TVP38/TMEM64 family)
MKKLSGRQFYRLPFRLIALGMLMLGGLCLSLWQPSYFMELLAKGRELASNPLTSIAMVLLLAALLTLAMPGSLMVLIIAPLYPPRLATVLLTTGGVLGSLGAYALARWAGRTGPAEGSRALLLLTRHGDFLTQLGLRIMPAFPHSVVNYGAGFLGLPVGSFLTAALVGLTVKWYIYSAAIHALVTTGVEQEGSLGLRTAAPLLLLAGLLFAGGLVRRRLQPMKQKDRKSS